MTMKEWEDYYNHDNSTEGAGAATEGTSEDPVGTEEAQPPQESGILISLFQERRERSKFALKVLPQASAAIRQVTLGYSMTPSVGPAL